MALGMTAAQADLAADRPGRTGGLARKGSQDHRTGDQDGEENGSHGYL